MSPARRPFGVTLLVVLIVIQGLLGVVGGITVIALRHRESFLRDVSSDANHLVTSNDLLTYGIIAIVFGVIYLLVARGLAHGNGFARFLVAIVSLLNLIGGIYLAVERRGTLRTQGITEAVIAFIVLAILFSGRANRFFREN
jgi:lysylphosphatidylglycerol synthetase-like protein (DUF2156 family)